MVQAILAGNKAQTRRVVKPQPSNGWQLENPPVLGKITSKHTKSGKFGVFIKRLTRPDFPETDIILCPYGQIGDQLWVRETWAKCFVAQAGQEWFVYRTCDNRTDYGGPWKPSIHMPRWASRIQLEITNIRVERLQDISEADAMAEGCESDMTDWGSIYWFTGIEGYKSGKSFADSAKEAFTRLWEIINGAESWTANPWVWVIEFKRVDSQP